MKFCPYCGAALVAGAASFCAECGKSLPAAAKSQSPARETQTAPTCHETVRRPAPPGSEIPQSGSRKPGRSVLPSARKKPMSEGKRSMPKHPVKRSPKPAREPNPDPRDEGYDGYYDDVRPTDNGHTRDRADPELVKRIVSVTAGALTIVILSVILMYVL